MLKKVNHFISKFSHFQLGLLVVWLGASVIQIQADGLGFLFGIINGLGVGWFVGVKLLAHSNNQLMDLNDLDTKLIIEQTVALQQMAKIHVQLGNDVLEKTVDEQRVIDSVTQAETLITHLTVVHEQLIKGKKEIVQSKR